MKPSKEVAIRELSRLFHRNGYVRRQNTLRYRSEGYQRYKKGDEVRLTANSEKELSMIQCLLAEAGIQFGRPFPKSNQFRQPIYGRDAVRKFLEMIQGNDRVGPPLPVPNLPRLPKQVKCKDIKETTTTKQRHPEERPTRRCSRRSDLSRSVRGTARAISSRG